MRGRRILADEVVRAFETTGLAPVAGVFYERDGDGTGPDKGCGLTAVAVAVGVEPICSMADLQQTLGITRTYLESFADGWDAAAVSGPHVQETERPRGPVARQGHDDGRAAFAAVLLARVRRLAGPGATPRAARQIIALELARLQGAPVPPPARAWRPALRKAA